MNIIEFKSLFFNTLSSIYPETEITSFFQILIKHRLNLTRLDVALSPNIALNDNDYNYLKKALQDLEKEYPIQYIIGITEFFRLPFKVNKNVLIPRPETEELVSLIINDNKAKGPINILDIGTGSGCIAIALAKNLPNANVFAIDISHNALEIAKINANNNKVHIHFIEADVLNLTSFNQLSVFNSISSKNSLPIFDVIVSNPPYVRLKEKSQMKKNVLNYEPEIALFVQNNDPLIFYRKIAALAKLHLTPHGTLYFEINQYLAAETTSLLHNMGYKNIILKQDIYNNNRIIKTHI